MAFHVGQKVVCVDDLFDPRSIGTVWTPAGLRRGAVYTITWTGDHISPTFFGIPCVRIAEISRQMRPCDRMENPPFAARRFRPLRTTSLSIFTSMLTKPPAKTKRVRA